MIERHVEHLQVYLESRDETGPSVVIKSGGPRHQTRRAPFTTLWSPVFCSRVTVLPETGGPGSPPAKRPLGS